MPTPTMEHITVYRDEKRFCAWPFNAGMWQFADGELAVGFKRSSCSYDTPESVGHRKSDLEGCDQIIIRSYDGGLSWNEDSITTVLRRPEFDRSLHGLSWMPTLTEKTYDPTADGYCLISGFGMPPDDLCDRLFVIISTDRGQTWSSPVRVPPCRFFALYGRPSYIVRPDGMLLLFAHGSRLGEKGGSATMTHSEAEAVPVVFGSRDGGVNWGLIGEMEPVPKMPMAIMPYPLQLKSGRILAAVRRQYFNAYNAYTQIYASDDGGRSWRFISRSNDWGAPANLVELPDGRILCVYGYRQPPYGIRAVVSEDGGKTWGTEITLRDDGGSWDLGYPRTMLRPDGKLVTVYYFNSKDDPIQQDGGVRHIAATIWSI